MGRGKYSQFGRHRQTGKQQKKKEYYVGNTREDTARCDGWARQKQRALVLVFRYFTVIHLPFNTKS